MSSDSPFFYTWTAQRDARPVNIVGGEGAFFTTAEGDRVLDMGSLIYQANLGHGHRGVIEAIKAQADSLCLSLPNGVYPAKERLARALLDRAPRGFRKVFFTLGGSDANENALKIARLFTGRYKALARYRSYHGATLGAVALTGDWRRVAVEPVIPGAVHVDDWSCVACPGGLKSRTCDHPPVSRIPQVLALEGNVGAVFLEPVVGHNGVLIPPPGYFRAVREACDAHGALLVADEVLTGFGRTGKFFAIEHMDGVVPDLITCAKGLTAGYGTLGAVLVHERVAAHFEDHVLAAGLTFYAHPLGVAAAVAALAAYEEEGLVERAARLEPVLEKRLLEASARLGERSGPPRVIGLLGALPAALSADQWKKLKAALWDRRVHAHPSPGAGCVVLAPPLCIGADELADGVERVVSALEEVLS